MSVLKSPSTWAEPQGDFGKTTELQRDGNHSDAIELFQLAAKEGHVEAQVQMGKIHANGMGVPQNFIKARIWYDIAVSNGSSAGIWGRRNAEKNLSEADIAVAKQKAQLCLDTNYQDCN